MKNLKIIISVAVLVLVGAVCSVSVLHKSSFEKFSQKFEANATAPTAQSVAKPSEAAKPAPTRMYEPHVQVSTEALENEYHSLSNEQIEAEIKRVTSTLEKQNLIELANQQRLTDAQASELATLIRKQSVLRMMIIERELDSI
jgi:hypothetical protein